jgi:hypothetical protein
MEGGELLIVFSGVVAAVGSALRAFARDIAGALVAGAVSLLAFAALIVNL